MLNIAPTMSSDRTGKTILLFLVIYLSYNPGYAQIPHNKDLSRKKVSDTILRRRTLTMPDPFNATRALRRLFPGKWYDLRAPGCEPAHQLVLSKL